MLRVKFELAIDFRSPVRLSEYTSHKAELSVHGIYVFTEGKYKGSLTDLTTTNIVMIGKANNQSVFQRCVRHHQSVCDLRSASGNPLSGPGKSFIAYRERIGKDPSKLWVTPGVMDTESPFLISCAEEYFLYQFAKKNKRQPWCNSAGQVKDLLSDE